MTRFMYVKFVPATQMDWEEIRVLKLALCPACRFFDELLGGCKLHKLATKCQKGVSR